MKNDRKTHPQRILLAIDGSEHAFSAIKLLKNIPLPEKSEIVALAVLAPRNTSQHAALKSALTQAEKLLSASGIKVSTELVVGNPSEQIAVFSEQINPDLLVMGAKGLRATLGIFLGGVAQQIVEYSDRPVLVVRKGYVQMKEILFATDGSDSSENAGRYLDSFALPSDVRIHAMHVLPGLVSEEMLLQTWPVGMEMVPVIPTEEMKESLEKQAAEEQRAGEELLAGVNEAFSASGKSCITVLKRGDAATEIIEYAREKQIDTIVIGSRGLNKIKSWLLGSVSRKLLHYAPCSVMVVKTHR